MNTCNLGNIENPLKGLIVERVVNQRQVSNHVLDLCSVKKLEAANDAVGQADRSENLQKEGKLKGGEKNSRSKI